MSARQPGDLIYVFTRLFSNSNSRGKMELKYRRRKEGEITANISGEVRGIILLTTHLKNSMYL